MAMAGSALARSNCCCDDDASTAAAPCLSITASTCCNAPVAVEVTGPAFSVPTAGALAWPAPTRPALCGDRPGSLRSDALLAPLRTIILRL